MGWGSGVAVNCGVGCRLGSDPALLWLWRRLAATTLIQPLAWELPYAVSAALKKRKQMNSARVWREELTIEEQGRVFGTMKFYILFVMVTT